MSTCVFGTPIYSDPSVTYTPTFSGGSWVSTLPLTNLANRALGKVARSTTAGLNDTIVTADLKTDRPVRLVGITKHSMSSAGRWRVVGLPSISLANYEPADNLNAKGATFSRASTAMYVDANGIVQTASSGTVRDAHYIDGTRYLRLEAGSTNLALRSQEFDDGTWVVSATVTANTATAPDGTTTADTLTDSSVVQSQVVQQSLTVANDSATYTTSVWLKQSTSRYAAVSVTFLGGTAFSSWVVADLQAGAITATGGGVSPIRTSITAYLNGWYRVSVTTANNATGNTQLTAQIYAAWNSTGVSASDPATTGSVYGWGAQVEAKATVTSYIATTSATVTRSADSLSLTYSPTPAIATVYVKFVEGGSIGMASAGVVYIGNAGNTGARLYIDSTGSFYRLTHHNGTSAVTSTLAAAPTVGQTVELRGVLYADGSIQLSQSINGAAETSAAGSAANSLAGSWSGAFLYLNSTGSSNAGVNAFRAVRIASGANTLATMQGLVYDSGWLTPWPGSLTAEDLAKPDGTSLNVLAYTQVPSTFNNARYWTIQFDDTANTAGYIDVARLCITGAFTPSVTMNDGDKPAFQDDSITAITPGGAALYDVRGLRRTHQFSISNLQQAESLASVRQMQRKLGTTGQFLWIPDPADTTYGYDRNFVAVMRELGPLESSSTRYNTTFSVAEDL